MLEQVRQSGLKAIFVFIAPPSVEELKARLQGRNTESTDQVSKRLANAKEELARSASIVTSPVCTAVVMPSAAHQKATRNRFAEECAPLQPTVHVQSVLIGRSMTMTLSARELAVIWSSSGNLYSSWGCSKMHASISSH